MTKRVCKNCGKSITCGCQARTAKNGQACCSSCVDQYNKNLQQLAKQ
jgi:hypothetical protein